MNLLTGLACLVKTGWKFFFAGDPVISNSEALFDKDCPGVENGDSPIIVLFMLTSISWDSGVPREFR